MEKINSQKSQTQILKSNLLSEPQNPLFDFWCHYYDQVLNHLQILTERLYGQYYCSIKQHEEEFKNLTMILEKHHSTQKKILEIAETSLEVVKRWTFHDMNNGTTQPDTTEDITLTVEFGDTVELAQKKCLIFDTLATKHSKVFLETLSSANIETCVKGTSRLCEILNGKGKAVIQWGNIFQRDLVILSILQCHHHSPQQIKELVFEYSDKFNLRTLARSQLDATLTRKDHQYNNLISKVDKIQAKDDNNVYDHLFRMTECFLQCEKVIEEEETLQKKHMVSFLKNKQIATDKLPEKELLKKMHGFIIDYIKLLTS